MLLFTAQKRLRIYFYCLYLMVMMREETGFLQLFCLLDAWNLLQNTLKLHLFLIGALKF